MDSQKIDSLLRKSVDCFLDETKDIYKSLERLNKLKQKENQQTKQPKDTDVGYNQVPMSYASNSGGFQRSASQKYNYRKGNNDQDSRLLHIAISPLNSGEKPRSNMNSRVKSNAMLGAHQKQQIPSQSPNFTAPPRYSSLMPNQYGQDQETYYAQIKDHGRPTAHYSFSAPRKSDNLPENYVNQVSTSLNYPAEHRTTLDENQIITERYNTVQISNVPNAINTSPEFQYYSEQDEARSNSQRQIKHSHKSPMVTATKGVASSDKIKYPETHSTEYSPRSKLAHHNLPSVKHPQKNAFNVIEEEHESKASKDFASSQHKKMVHGHIRTHTQVNNS